MPEPRKQGFAETMRRGWKPPSRRNGAAPAPPAAVAGPPELVKRREQLSSQFAELQWDLGGMAYEMASRNHFRLDVLNKHAAKLQEVDAELGQIELVLKLDEAGASGTCPACGALHARGAVFCWQCGNELQQPVAKAAGSTEGA